MSIGSSELEVLVFLYVSGGYVGRKTLSRELGIGEGAVRRILDSLRSKGLVKTVRSGSRLTGRGKSFLEDYLSGRRIVALRSLRLEDYGNYRFAVAAHVRGITLDKSVVEIRDCSVKGGSDGALIIVFQNNSLLLPPGYERLSDYLPRTSDKILRAFDLDEGDKLFVPFSREGVGACVRGILGILGCLGG